MKGGCDQYRDGWVAVFVENDKGVLSVRGVTMEDALERGLELLDPFGRSKTKG
jgi:hypothetical protein